MNSSVRRMCGIAAMLILVLGFVSSASAQYKGGVPWQTGDIVACFGTSGGFGGACNVLRIVNGSAVLLDQFTDSLSGNTFGVAINNTLHVVATDDADNAGNPGNGSKVVVYSVASLNPNTNSASPIAHAPVLYPPDPHPYYDTSAGGGSMAKAVAISNAGNIFVLNSTSPSGPNIVEIGPGPAQAANPIATLSLAHCLTTQGTPITQATSMDLSAAADANGNPLYAYVTSGGTIQQVTLATGVLTPTCNKFADFGSGVTLFGIKDIPASALPVNCGSGAVSCPATESILVVAKGVVDIDTGETEEAGDPDAVNICTNATGATGESCAVLLKAQNSNPSLTGPVWAASHLYPTVDDTILDAFLHVEKVITPGTSGADEPAWSQGGATIRDNAVVWADQGGWTANTLYSVGRTVGDTNAHLWQVAIAGKSGLGQPLFTSNDSPPGSGITYDNAVTWTNRGAPLPWSASTAYTVGQFILDSNSPQHVQQVSAVTGDTTTGANEPQPCPAQPCQTGQWQDGPTPGGMTQDNNVTWIDRGVAAWQATHTYNLTDAAFDGANIEQVTTAGTSAATSPSWNILLGGPTIDGLKWSDQGSFAWQATHVYAPPANATDANGIVVDPTGNVQKVTTGGTSGPAAVGSNPPTPYSGWNETTGGVTTDGLQWKDQSTSPQVVARYRVNSTSIQTTLQSLALDPLIVDCTAGCSFPFSLKVTSVITSPGTTNASSLSSPGFWMGDNSNPYVWKLDFASGTAVQFFANGGCSPPNCTLQGGIQGLGIYGSEGSNQPGLARLLFNDGSTGAPPNPQTGVFPSSGADPAFVKFVKNSLDLTLLNGSSPAPSLGPFALYASPVAPLSCFDDSPGNPFCLGSFQPGPLPGTGTNFPIMWKNDIPLPSSGNLALSSTQTLAGNFDFPTNFRSLSNDVALDSLFDTTTLVGLDLPGFTKPSTVHGRQQTGKNGTAEQDFKCAFTSPVISPSHSCFANPGTLPLKFSCSQLTATQMAKYGVSSSTPWGPNFQVVEFPGAPIPIPTGFSPPPPNPLCNGTASTGSVPSSANAGNNASQLQPGGCTVAQLPGTDGPTATFRGGTWAYNWTPKSTSAGVVYQILAYDDSDGTWFNPSTPKKGKPVSSGFFYVKNSCP